MKKYRGEQEPQIGLADHRVPFLLKAPHQQQALEVGGMVSNMIIHDLVLALLRGDPLTVEQAASWIRRYGARDRSATRCPSAEPCEAPGTNWATTAPMKGVAAVSSDRSRRSSCQRQSLRTPSQFWETSP